LINFSTLKDALNRQKKSKDPKSPKSPKLPNVINDFIFENNKQILFKLKVAKWNSTNKLSFNNYLILTKELLCHFKNAEKAAKVFYDIYDSDINASSENIIKLLPAQHVALMLDSVYAISEELIPDPYIRIDFVSSSRKHDSITITAPDFQKHQQLLSNLRLAIRNINPIGPYITPMPKSQIIEQLISLEDWVYESMENLLVYKVLLKSLKDGEKKQNEKKLLIAVFFVLGRNNIYLIPADYYIDEYDKNSKQQTNFHYPLLIEESKPKEIDIRKFQYPIMCLANIQSTEQDTFRLTFKSNNGFLQRTMDIASLFSEIIISELRFAIDSITFWWPYSTYTLGTQTSVPAERSITSPRFDKKISHESGLERMIEAQCHAFRILRSRISFTFERVPDTEDIEFRQGSGHLLFSFTLHPPTTGEGTYTGVELFAIL
ncbi:11264_t:CDS:1, partial [Scutellospora calospora]